MKIATYEQMVTHLEQEFELNGLDFPNQLQKNVVSPYATNTNAERPKRTCHHCKKNKHITEISVPFWTRKSRLKAHKLILATKKVAPRTLLPTTTKFIIKTIKRVIKQNESQKLFIHAVVRPVAKRITPQRNAMFEPMQQKGHFIGRANRKDRVDTINRTHRTVWLVVSGPQPNILTRNATSSLRNCDWQTGDHQKKFLSIAGVVWQQLLETSVESSS